jgi:hypothetical protein
MPNVWLLLSVAKAKLYLRECLQCARYSMACAERSAEVGARPGPFRSQATRCDLAVWAKGCLGLLQVISIGLGQGPHHLILLYAMEAIVSAQHACAPSLRLNKLLQPLFFACDQS